MKAFEKTIDLQMWPQNASWFTRQLFIISSEFSCLAQPKRLLGLEGLQQALLSFLVTSKEEEGEGRQRLLSQKRKGSLTWPAARRRKHSIYTVVYVTQFWKAVLQQASKLLPSKAAGRRLLLSFFFYGVQRIQCGKEGPCPSNWSPTTTLLCSSIAMCLLLDWPSSSTLAAASNWAAAHQRELALSDYSTHSLSSSVHDFG